MRQQLVSRSGHPGIQTGARGLMPAAGAMPLHRRSLVRSQLQKGRNNSVSALFTSARTPSPVVWHA
jgi:hypothetical protein